MIEKKCSTCKEVKLVSEFSKNVTKKSGYRNECKVCQSIKRKIAYKRKVENKMNSAQRKEIIDSLNKMQLQVYEVVPLMSQYSYNQINAAYQKAKGTTLPRTQFNQILQDLVIAGVVVEMPKGYYTRAVVESAAVQDKPETVNALKSIKPVEQSTIVMRTRYSGIVDEILRMESRLSNLKLLVSEFAAETDKKLNENNKALTKAAQIKELMKALAE